MFLRPSGRDHESQMERTKRLDQADDVVENHGSLQAFHEQLAGLHQRYLKMANAL